MVENTPYTRPVENTPYTKPVDPARPNEHVRETTRDRTVVKSGGSNGLIAGVVLVVLLGIAGYFFLAGDESNVSDTTAPAVENNMDAVPPADQASPAAPAPEAPAGLAPSPDTQILRVDPNSPTPATPAPATPATGG